MNNRRKFIVALGAGAFAPRVGWPQRSTVPVIGYVGNSASIQRSPDAFRKGLSEAGYVDGKNVTIEYRWVDGKNDRLPNIISEFVSRRVDVIAAVGGTAAALAAKAATRSIPIVFRIGGDPVAVGLVESLSRPGSNITGITTLGVELGQKRLEMLRELLPAGSAVALLVNPTNANAATERKQIEAAARLLGLRLQTLEVKTADEIDAAFASIAKRDISGIVTVADPFLFRQRDQLVVHTARRAIPTIFSDRYFCEAGGLMSYGTDSPDGHRRAGEYAGRILKGAKPSELPVQQSTKIELVVNLKTARALGIKIPNAIMLRADEVLE
jgi:putative ABC transport system substrate-binding protein